MSGSEEFGDYAIEEVARLYRADGYAVERADSAKDLSRDLANVDLIARKGDETVFVEVRRSSRYVRLDADDELPALARAVSGIENSRLDVVTFPDPSDALPERDELLAKASGAASLVASHDDAQTRAASFLLATSALEGALRVLAVRAELFPDPDATIGGLTASLWSLGLLDEHQWQSLQALSDTRDALAHGLKPGRPLSPTDLTLAVELVEVLVSSAFLDAEDVVAWFRERYKDPADGVPYNGREGGYLYVNGGPYDAAEVLSEAFVSAPPSVIEEALRELSFESSEWVGVEEY